MIVSLSLIYVDDNEAEGMAMKPNQRKEIVDSEFATGVFTAALIAFAISIGRLAGNFWIFVLVLSAEVLGIWFLDFVVESCRELIAAAKSHTHVDDAAPPKQPPVP